MAGLKRLIEFNPRSAPALSVINEFLTSLVISAWSLSSSRAKVIVKFQRYLHGHVTMFFSTSQFCICLEFTYGRSNHYQIEGILDWACSVGEGWVSSKH